MGGSQKVANGWQSPAIVMSTMVAIARPQRDVYAFLADWRNMPSWNYYILQVIATSPLPLRVGSRLQQTRKEDSQELRVTALQPEERVAVETLPPTRRMEIELTLEPGANGGTVVRETWTAELGWFLGFLRPILTCTLKPRFDEAVGMNLGKLKELLETGSTVLQDKREVRRDASGSGHLTRRGPRPRRCDLTNWRDLLSPHATPDVKREEPLRMMRRFCFPGPAAPAGGAQLKAFTARIREPGETTDPSGRSTDRSAE
eukprot:CAMPEP_0206034812 /NCGR_PEP_ID=MMETSP1466-20131121/1640_1 /ASSEMBLY_ACC=CAM_ASM_001126 /TAXON_ID=44452 /ORGANISM="Pavlova gyrans, Strain CCMP608" /LENGTH=258 /DNA_ID=CAMNT_0053409139 /DNA_START=30 /DNA_END=808 /DNA_ORIENTATION=-